MSGFPAAERPSPCPWPLCGGERVDVDGRATCKACGHVGGVQPESLTAERPQPIVFFFAPRTR